MLDIRWIRENPEALDRALTDRRAEPAAGRLIALDEARRAAIAKLQDLQTRRNAASKEIGQAKAKKDEARAAELMAEVTALKDSMAAAEKEEKDATKALEDALAIIPNVPLEDVPVGDETANKEVRKWGDPRRVNWAKEHFELGEALGQMDFETAAKLSGSRFVVLKAGLARMERALGQFMLDLHTTEHGYMEVQPPLLVKDDVVFGTGQLPKAAEDMFRTSRRTRLEDIGQWLAKMRRDYREGGGDTTTHSDEEWAAILAPRILKQIRGTDPEDELLTTNLWLIPTAEVSLTNLVRDSILTEEELPLRFTALTPCFRSEAGSAGKDTRGMLRQHQFDKVELVTITTPEKSLEEHERMTLCAEEVLRQLDLAYRTMVLSTGDMGFGAKKTYDLEVWLPGQKAFREISSCSVCGDFQARRMRARYRPGPMAEDGTVGGAAVGALPVAGGRGINFVHTLNGSGVAVGRALIAVMETYQNEDGSITVPDVLRPYMGGVEKVGP